MAGMRKRIMWVIQVYKLNEETGEKEWIEHSRTKDRFDSMNVYDALLKAGLKPGRDVSCGPQYY